MPVCFSTCTILIYFYNIMFQSQNILPFFSFLGEEQVEEIIPINQ